MSGWDCEEILYVFSFSILRHSRLTAFDWTLTIATQSDKLKVTTVVVPPE